MSCDVTIPSYQSVDGSLKVSEKYKQLMQDSMSDDSLYIRAKDTFAVLFKDLQLSETEKAKISAENIASMTSALSATAMQVALSWEKEERDGAYSLAKERAATDLVLAQALKAKEEICLVQKQTEKTCAEITAKMSETYRENGMPTGYESDGCKPTGLDNTGLKYHQTMQVQADTYSRYADAYRKSGVVTIGIDVNDGELKGTSGSTDPIQGGYTNQQTINAERQRISYEDSKRNHVANSSASFMAQLLASEEGLEPGLLQSYKDAIDYMNTSHSTTSSL